MDHFERLGLPRRFSLNAADLERHYLARSREAHPDYFQQQGALEQRGSMEWSASLNEAYTTLRDPFRRAEYLLQLENGPSAAEEKEMPAAFLEEMLELRMSIEEIKDAPESAEFEAMAGQLRERRESLLRDVGQRLDQQETGGVGPADLRQIRQLLNATKFVQGLIRDLHADRPGA